MKNGQKTQLAKDLTGKEAPVKMKQKAAKCRDLWVGGYPSYFGGA